MKRLAVVITLALFLLPLGCDRPVAGPDLAPLATTNDQKIKIKGGITKGQAPQVVAVTGPPGNQRMMLWELNSPAYTAIDLTPPGFASASPGDWSPDGTQLVFFGEVPPSPTPVPGLGVGWDIYVMDIATDGTPDFSSIAHVSWANPHPDFAPSWSPDGTMIAWQCHQPPKAPSLRPNTAICYSEKTPMGWGLMQQLSSDPGASVTTFFHDGWPSWSPAGDVLIFSRLAAGCFPEFGFPGLSPCPFPSFDLFTVDVATAVETRLTQTDTIDEESPAWEPKQNSTLIAYTIGNDNDEYDIYTSHLAAFGVRYQVTSMAGGERYPWWVPGGKQITYVQGPNSDTDVYIVDVGGTNNTNLTNSPGVLDFFARVRPEVITP
jgi:Tol biopolymer transport system component